MDLQSKFTAESAEIAEGSKKRRVCLGVLCALGGENRAAKSLRHVQSAALGAVVLVLAACSGLAALEGLIEPFLCWVF